MCRSKILGKAENECNPMFAQCVKEDNHKHPFKQSNTTRKHLFIGTSIYLKINSDSFCNLMNQQMPHVFRFWPRNMTGCVCVSISFGRKAGSQIPVLNSKLKDSTTGPAHMVQKHNSGQQRIYVSYRIIPSTQ